MTHYSQLSAKAAALRVIHLPLVVCGSVAQLQVSAGTKKLLAATVFGTVSLLFLARHFQRRRGRKKAASPQWDQAGIQFFSSAAPEAVLVSAGAPRERSESLASSADTSSSGTCAIESSCWDRLGDAEICSVVATPENLYLMGMDLFEEALRRWEEALTFRSKQTDDDLVSLKMGAVDAVAEENMEDVISAEFMHRLKSLLQRAYRLQGEFEGVLGGTSEPSSNGSSQGRFLSTACLTNDYIVDEYLTCLSDILSQEELDDACLRDSISIASTDSFVSAAELSEHKELRSISTLTYHPFYEEALQMAEEGKISCRVLRTEMLECLGDVDFLAKLHCVRQACQLILCERTTRLFLADTGKKILSSIIVKAQKSPKRFEEVFEEMMCFLEQAEHWENTAVELATRGVKHLNFYDIVLDFILMDSFEDLENPPVSIQNVVNNRWLNSSFKETAVASSCWSVLKQKRQHMKVPDGFIARFYTLCEQISPVLAWGFLGPKSSLHDFCCFFKDQVVHFLKDVFDLEKVRYSSVDSLAEDMLHLLHRRSELLLAYLGADSLRPNGCNAAMLNLLPAAIMEARMQ
ncbi:mitoguardin 1 isoform X1 [Hippocampus comes]|uniref:mitoguardin 1 isoform X1 n=1 Tax=Hippocampus comes TaxID=109280 RepID=UPI00094E002B|nr:PREDICTED: mitoguardin 1 isoform X1 [Hippocampus comes]XP_019712247.1 PREDICTED: mitoguardin 1 isoform X1 [Hippocampus comes]XP_019712248.1 PREDICTED: mitoguardin 1 isoform X1 [Hippocampus comes]